MSSTAMPVYLSFAQWQSDLICHEAAVLVTKQGKPDLLLSTLASNLTKASKRVLVDNSCKLKRFLASASEDFIVEGAGGTELVTFIGSALRFEKPQNMPLDVEEATAHITAAAAALHQPACRESVIEEVAGVLADQARPLLVSQLGSFLSNKTKSWLRSQRVRLLAFVRAEQATFAVSDAGPQELISLARESESYTPQRKLSISSVCSTAESVSSCSSNGAAVVRSLFMGYSAEDIAMMLVNSQPLFYED